MRHSIIGGTLQQVRSVGALNIKEARSIKIIFADVDEVQVSKLRAMGCTISKVGGIKAAVYPPVLPPSPVAALPTYSPEQLSWATGLDDLRLMVRPPLHGQGFNLAMLDTGVRETHKKINGRVVFSKNYTSDPMKDGFNHGTGTCSIALAVAPLCSLLNMKVLDNEGVGTEEMVVLAIDDCIALHDTDPGIAPSVINISLGAPDDGNPDSPMRVACRAAVSAGIYILAAAGNDGPNPGTILSPGCERHVLAVGSCDYEPFAISNFSSRGPTMEGLVKPDSIMFGRDIAVASSESDIATVAKSGTSFSVPFGSGMAMLYHEGILRGAEAAAEPLAELLPGETFWVSPGEMIDDWLSHFCLKPEGNPAGKDNGYGWGIPFGPFIAQALGVGPAFDISGLLTGVMAIAMMGMMMKVMR